MGMMIYPTSSVSSGQEISRLLTAAVVNQNFRTLLLSNPAIALTTGYNGEPFQLESEVRERVISIRAQSLQDFALQLTERETSGMPPRSLRQRRFNHSFPAGGMD